MKNHLERFYQEFVEEDKGLTVTTDNASYISIDKQNPSLFFKSFGKMSQTAVLPHLILTHAFLGERHFKEIACSHASKIN